MNAKGETVLLTLAVLAPACADIIRVKSNH
jgi:hypothetical protein